MASAAMQQQQHHHQLDAGHQSSGAQNSRHHHHLMSIGSAHVAGAIGSAYQHHHHYASPMDGHQHHQQQHQQQQAAVEAQHQATSNEAHFYYHQASSHQGAHHHHHQHQQPSQHYYGAASDSGYAPAYGSSQQHYEQLSSSSGSNQHPHQHHQHHHLDHYASHYPFIQSFTAAAAGRESAAAHEALQHQQATGHQQQRPYAYHTMSEATEHQRQPGGYPATTVEADQGRSVDSNHRNTTTTVASKLETNINRSGRISEDSIGGTNKIGGRHQQQQHNQNDKELSTETILTELALKSSLGKGSVHQNQAQIQDSLTGLASGRRSHTTPDNNTNNSGQTEPSLKRRKRSRLASSKTTSAVSSGDEGFSVDKDDNNNNDDDDDEYTTTDQRFDLELTEPSEQFVDARGHHHQLHSSAAGYLEAGGRPTNGERPHRALSSHRGTNGEDDDNDEYNRWARKGDTATAATTAVVEHVRSPALTTRTDRSSTAGLADGDSNELQQRVYTLPTDPVALNSGSHPLTRFSASTGGFYDELDGEDEDEEEAEEKVSPGKLRHGASVSNAAHTTTINNTAPGNSEYNQLRILEMRKEKSRDAARSRRSKENHEFYELAKLLPLPAAITSQLDFLDKASIIRLTISFLKLRQFSVNGHPPWAPDFTTLGSINPYSTQSLSNYAEHYANNNQDDSPQARPTSVVASSTPSTAAANSKQQTGATVVSTASSESTNTNRPYSRSSSGIQDDNAGLSIQPSNVAFPAIDHQHQYQQQPAAGFHHQLDGNQLLLAANEKAAVAALTTKNTASLFEVHQGTHILQSLDGFAFAIGRDGRFLYISETVSMYLGLSQVEMTGSSVFDYTHQQDHEELAKQLGISYATTTPADCNQDLGTTINSCGESPPPTSVHSQYSAASNETLIEDYMNSSSCPRKRAKTTGQMANQTSSGTTTTTSGGARGAYGRNPRRPTAKQAIKIEATQSDLINNEGDNSDTLTMGGTHQINPSTVKTSTQTKDSTTTTTTTKQGTKEDPLVRQFCIRMKSTLTKRGCQHFKSSGYRVVHVVAHLRSYQSNDHGHLMDPLDEAGAAGGGNQTATGMLAKQAKRRGPKTGSKDTGVTNISNNKELNNNNNKGHQQSNDNTLSDTNLAADRKPAANRQKIIGMVAVAIALPPPSINELRLESDTFVLRLGLDLRITHIEPKITELLHYPVDYVAGRSLYSLIHPADVHQVQKCHRDLLKKGQMMSGYYRLLARTGGYIWIQTCATLICSNTLASGQSAVAALPSSPLPPTNHGEHLLKLPSYLTAPIGSAAVDSLQPANNHHQHHQHQYGNASSVSVGSKLASPAAHLNAPGTGGGGYETIMNQDQDQCVIFVNYMITNILEVNEMLDVCQSPNYKPLSSSSFSGNTSTSNNSHTTTNSSSNNNNNSLMFNSPSSSCSSPCLGSLKNASTGCPSYPSTPNDSVVTNLSSPRRQHGADQSKQAAREMKLAASGGRGGRGATSGGNQKSGHKGQQGVYLSGEENGLGSTGGGHITSSHGNHYNMQTTEATANKQLDATNSLYESAAISSAAETQNSNAGYSYPQTPGSVNLALNKVHGGVGNAADSSWLGHHHPHHHHHSHHQTTATGRLASETTSATAAVYGAAAAAGQNVDHYSSMNRSIYKAAFGLDVGTATNYGQHHHHHQQPSVYPATAPSYQAAAAASVGNTWDSAAVAAVAAASNLTSHHHHHQSANPYAHLESHHHHHHQAAAAHGLSSATAAAANSHQHTSAAAAAGTYYNYYGYYGNKFI